MATITQSFAGIASAQTLVAFDARFEQIVGSFDGLTPSGGSLSTAGTGDHLARIKASTAIIGAAQYVQWTHRVTDGGNNFIGGALRMSAAGSGYGVIIDRSQAFLNRYASGAFAASFGSTLSAPPAGTVCRFEFDSGGNWVLKFDGSTVASGTDTNYASGQPGLAGFNNFADGLGNYEAGDAAAVNVFNPLTGRGGGAAQPLA